MYSEARSETCIEWIFHEIWLIKIHSSMEIKWWFQEVDGGKIREVIFLTINKLRGYTINNTQFKIWSGRMDQKSSTCCCRRVLRNCVTKTDICFGFPTAFFVFLTPLRIFSPRVEIIFFINNYFLVFIFNYHISLCEFDWYFNFNSGLEI